MPCECLSRCTLKRTKNPCPCLQGGTLCTVQCHPVKVALPPVLAQDKKNNENKKKKIVNRGCLTTLQYLNPPKTIEVDISTHLNTSAKNAIQLILDKKVRVALVPLFEVGKKLEFMVKVREALETDRKYMFNTYNNHVSEEYRVPPPSVDMLLAPEQHVDDWRPYINKRLITDRKKSSVFGLPNGMVNFYTSQISQLLIRNPVVIECFTLLYGEHWRVFPNRLRLQPSMQVDKVNEPHWEYMRGDISTIISMSEERYFTFYDIDFEAAATQTYIQEHKMVKNFNKIPEKNLHEHELFRGKRRRIRIPQGYMLLFDDQIPHEVDKTSLSFSVFLSPYDLLTRKNKDLLNFYGSQKINAKSITKHKFNPWDQPREYENLTVYESNNVGQLFGMGGIIWPSRKTIFQVAHQQNARDWKIRFQGNAQPSVHLPNGTFNMKDNRARLEANGFQFPEIVYNDDFPNAIFNPLDFDPYVAMRLGLKDITRHQNISRTRQRAPLD